MARVRTDVSEERIASIIMVTKIGVVGTLAITSYRSTPRRNTSRLVRLLVIVNFEEWCLLGCYAVWLLFWLWFLQEPHGVTTQKTTFFGKQRFHSI
jgi:hypothetical protein